MSEIRARAWSSIPLATDFTTGTNTASLSVSKHRWECETDHDFQCPVHRPDYITLHVAWIHTCATYNENIGEARYRRKTHAIGASLRREHKHLHCFSIHLRPLRRQQLRDKETAREETRRATYVSYMSVRSAPGSLMSNLPHQRRLAISASPSSGRRSA